MPGQRVFLTPDSARKVKDTVQQVRQVPPNRTVYRRQRPPTVQQFDGIWIYNNTGDTLPAYSVQPITSSYSPDGGATTYLQVDFDTTSTTFVETYAVVAGSEIPPGELGLAQDPGGPLTILGTGANGVSCGPFPANSAGNVSPGYPGDFFCFQATGADDFHENVFFYRPLVNLIVRTTAAVGPFGTSDYYITSFYSEIGGGDIGYTTVPPATVYTPIDSGKFAGMTKVNGVWVMTPLQCNDS